MPDAAWHDVGSEQELKRSPLSEVRVGRKRIALSWADGSFGAVSGVCNHAGGPLGEGRLDGDYVICPWHYWKFHRLTGEGEPGYEADRVPRHDVRAEGGRVYVSAEPTSSRNKLAHEPHPLARRPEPHDGPLRALGISTTAMDVEHPRYSTSDALLEVALEHARAAGLETRTSGSRSCVSATARASTRRARAPARGRARSRRWTPRTAWRRSTRAWCTGPT